MHFFGEEDFRGEEVFRGEEDFMGEVDFWGEEDFEEGAAGEEFSLSSVLDDSANAGKENFDCERPVGVNGPTGENVGKDETTGQLRLEERDELRDEMGEETIAIDTC